MGDASPAQKPRWVTLQDEINALPGMSDVKGAVNIVVNNAMANKMRVAAGLKPEEMNYNLLLTGSPGTGKTTIARKLGELYHELGIVKSPEVAQLTRADLVGQFANTAAATTKEQIDKNRGKLIFIDEAYTLYNGPTDQEGRQALDELMRLSEEYRNDTVIVLAGYDEHMERLFSANPGLKSRFRRRLDLPDYTPAEKVRVLDYMMNENKRMFANAQTRKRAAQYAAAMPSVGEHGNARAVRNFYDSIREAQAERLVSEFAGSPHDIPEDAFMTFTAADVELAAAEMKLPRPTAKPRKKRPTHVTESARVGYAKRKALRPVSHVPVASP